MNQQTLAGCRDAAAGHARASAHHESFKSAGMTKTSSCVPSWKMNGRPHQPAYQRLQKQASFRYPRSIEEIDYSLERGLDRKPAERSPR